MSRTESVGKSVEKLTSSVLVRYLTEQLAVNSLPNQAQSSLDTCSHQINHAIYTTSHPKRLQEKFSDLLELNDTDIPESVCLNIIQHQAVSRLLSDEIKDLIEPVLPVSTEYNICEIVNQLNQSISLCDKDEIRKQLVSLNITCSDNSIENALSTFLHHRYGPAANQSKDSVLELIGETLKKDPIDDGKQGRESIGDPLLNTSIDLLIKLDSTFNTVSTFVRLDAKRYLFLRDARHTSANLKENSLIERFYYSQLGIDYLLSVRAKLLMEEISLNEQRALDAFLLEHLNHYFNLLEEQSKENDTQSPSLKQCAEQYLQYQLAPIFVKYGLVNTLDDAIAMLKTLHPWVRLSMPSIVYATVYQVQHQCIAVVDSPLWNEAEGFQKEWDKALDSSNKPAWFDALSAEERKNFSFFHPYLQNTPSLSTALSFQLPGIKQAYRQAIYLIEEYEMYLLGEVKHSSMSALMTDSSERKDIEEALRISRQWVTVQKNTLRAKTSRLNILLSSKESDAILKNRLDPSAMSAKERVIYQAKKAAEEEGVLFSYLSLDAFNDLDRNHYAGIESVIEQINHSMKVIYQQDLRFMSALERLLLFKIETVLAYFIRLASERGRGSQTIGYRISMDAQSGINGLDIIANVIYLSFLNTQLKDSFIKSEPNNQTWSSLRCFEICYGSLSDMSGAEILNCHLIISTLKKQLLVGGDKAQLRILYYQTVASQSYSFFAMLYETSDNRSGNRKPYVGSLPADYPDDIINFLERKDSSKEEGFFPRTKGKQIGDAKQFWRETEWFIAKSLQNNEKRLVSINDLFVLSKVVILQNSHYFKLSNRLNKPLHLLLLHLSDVEKEALRSTLLEKWPDLKAVDCVNSLKISSYAFLSQLLDLEEDHSQSLIDAFLESETNIENAKRLHLIDALFKSLKGRERLSYNEEKACALIQQCLAVIRTNPIVECLTSVQKEILEKGFSLERLNDLLKNMHKAVVFESDNKDAAELIKLVDTLYATLPGGRTLTMDEKKQFIQANGLLPKIQDEASKRREGVKQIIHCALFEPQQKLGASLLRQVRHIIKKPSTLIQRDKTQSIQHAESIYQTYLIYVIKKRILSDPTLARWDVQGRVVIPVRLSDEDFEIIFLMMRHTRVDKCHAKDKVKEALGDQYVTDATLVSIDVTSHPVLETLYINWLSNTYNNNAVHQQQLKSAIRLLLTDVSRASIIPLYEEVAIFTRRLIGLLREIYETRIGELIEYDEQTWQDLFQGVSYVINHDILMLFQTGLLSAINNDKLDVKHLNVSLDNARESLYFTVKKSIIQLLQDQDRRRSSFHFYTAWEVIKQNLSTETNNFDGYLMEDYFRADHRNELAIRISATHQMVEQTFSGVKSDFRQLVRRNHYRTFSGISTITTLKKQQLNIRVPSLGLQFEEDNNGWQLLRGEKAVIQISDKLEDTYFIIKQLMGGYKEPLVYQVLSSLSTNEKSHFPLFRKQENKSIELILKGAHLFNQYQINRAQIEGLIYIQTIPVSYHTSPLSLSSKNPNIVEATLITALSLLYSLAQYSYLLPAETQEDIETLYTQAHRLYVNYLKSSQTEQTRLFSESAQGKQFIKELKQFKSKSMTIYQIKEDLNFLSLLGNALYRIFVEDVFKKKHYGMLVQAISTFLNEVGIVGRESGDSAHQAVCGRAELLESIYHRQSSLSIEETALIDSLNAFIRGEKAALMMLQQSLDIAYNKHNLYGTQIYFEENLSHLPELNDEKYVDPNELSGMVDMVQESPYVSWLIQEHSVSLSKEKESLLDQFIEAEQAASEVDSFLEASKMQDCEPLYSHTSFPVKNDFLPILIPYLVREIYFLSLMPILPDNEKVTFLTDLKQSFQAYYELNMTSFSFKHLFYFLINLNHELAFDLIFTPVLRRYLMIATAVNKPSAEEGSSYLTLNHTKQLDVISDDSLIQHILTPLGYVVDIYEDLEKKRLLKTLEGTEKELTINVLQLNDEYRLLESNILSLFQKERIPTEFKVYAETLSKIEDQIVFDELLFKMKNTIKHRLNNESGELVYRYTQLLDNDALRPSKEMSQDQSDDIDSIKAMSEQKTIDKTGSDDDKGDSDLSEAVIDTAIDALLTQKKATTLSVLDSLALLHDDFDDSTAIKMTSIAYIVLSPQTVETYFKQLSLITQTLPIQLKTIEEERDRLLISLSPSTALGRLFKDKPNILDQIENKIMLLEERLSNLHLLNKKLTSLSQKITQNKTKIGSRLFGNIRRTIHKSVDEETLMKGGCASIGMTGKAYSGLDIIPNKGYMLHEYMGQNKVTLSFIETNKHTDCLVTREQLSVLSSKMKIVLALLMCRQLFINMEHYPSLGNKIIISSDDQEMGANLWCVMHLLSDALNFNMKMIVLNMERDTPELSRRDMTRCFNKVDASLSKEWMQALAQTMEMLGPIKKTGLKSKSTKSIFQQLKNNKKQDDK